MGIITDRQERLTYFNQVLAERGLKQIPHVGNAADGMIELLEIEEILDRAGRFFTDIRFLCRFPNGADGAYTMRWNADSSTSDGAVIVPIINGQIAIVKQWRSTMGRWTFELPRGFGKKVDEARIKGELGTIQIGDLPLGTLVRELGDEVMATAKVDSITHLGNIAQNTGTDTATPSYFLVSIRTDERLTSNRLRGREEGLKVQLWSMEGVIAEIGSKLTDSHSITAVTLAMKHMGALSRLMSPSS